MGKKLNGAVYGTATLTIIAIVYLTLALPWVLDQSVSMSYARGSAEETEMPEVVNFVNNRTVVWDGFQNGTSNPYSPLLSDCIPYNVQTGVNGSFHSGTQTGYIYVGGTPWIGAGNPFINPDPNAGAFNWCITTLDEISIKLDPRSFKTTDDVALLRFNGSWLRYDSGPNAGGMNCDTIPGTYTTGHQLEMDWWVEVDGRRIFGEDVRVGDDDACWLDHVTSSGAWTVVHWDHVLSVTETWAMRNALNSTNASNVTLHWVCLNGPCDFVQDNQGSMAGSLYFRAEMTWYEAEDSYFWIKGIMLIVTVANLMIAVASTPMWNPMRSYLQGMGT